MKTYNSVPSSSQSVASALGELRGSPEVVCYGTTPVAVFLTNDPDMKKRILDALNDVGGDPTDVWGLPREVPPRVLDLKKDLLKELSRHGIQTATAEYSGYGDEGHFEGVSIEPTVNDTGWELNTKATSMLKERVEKFVEEVLDEYGIDWWNNEGGGGQATIDVAAGTVRFDHYQNIETQQQMPFDV